MFYCTPHHFSVLNLKIVGARGARWANGHYRRMGPREGVIHRHFVPWVGIRKLVSPPVVVHSLFVANLSQVQQYFVGWNDFWVKVLVRNWSLRPRLPPHEPLHGPFQSVIMRRVSSLQQGTEKLCSTIATLRLQFFGTLYGAFGRTV